MSGEGICWLTLAVGVGSPPALVDAGLRLLAAVLRQRRIVGVSFLAAAIIRRWIVDVERRSQAQPLGSARRSASGFSSLSPRYHSPYSAKLWRRMNSFSSSADGRCSLHASRSSNINRPSVISSLACSYARRLSVAAMEFSSSVCRGQQLRNRQSETQVAMTAINFRIVFVDCRRRLPPKMTVAPATN